MNDRCSKFVGRTPIVSTIRSADRGEGATIRREFIMHQYMYRENDVYEMNPQEMWTRWEKVR